MIRSVKTAVFGAMMAVAVAGIAGAQTTNPPVTTRETRDLRRDHRDLVQDRHDVRADQRDIRADKRDVRQDRRRIANP
jgi:Spy/CpxP family protein refolding chaperone